MTPRAVVRRPSPRLSEGLTTHIEPRPVDAGLALRQWQAYCDALRTAGWEVVEAPPADEHPDGVFVEDVAVAYGDTVVITRPGAPERAGEVEGMAELFSGLGRRVVDLPAGHLDGGDVLKHDDLVRVGLGGRTDEAGVDALRAVLAPLGARVEAVPVDRALHLKSAVTALPDGTVIGWEPAAPAHEALGEVLAMPEEGGAHVVLLGGERLLMAASAPRSADLLRERGYEVVTVDVSEFEAMEGCVTCLSVRLRD